MKCRPPDVSNPFSAGPVLGPAPPKPGPPPPLKRSIERVLDEQHSLALRLQAPEMVAQIYFACGGVTRRFVHGPAAAGSDWNSAPQPSFLKRMTSESEASATTSTGRAGAYEPGTAGTMATGGGACASAFQSFHFQPNFSSFDG